MIEWFHLRMGVDLATDTDAGAVPHCFTNEIPEYALEIKSEEGEWKFFSDIPVESLPEVVNSMHGTYERSVRLTENGYSVFTCWGLNKE